MSWKAKRYLTRHHLTPKTRNGKDTPENILYIYRNKHDVWHTLFGNLTLQEVIKLLLRVERAKGG